MSCNVYLTMLVTRGEGHSVAAWGIGGSVLLQIVQVQNSFIRAMGGG